MSFGRFKDDNNSNKAQPSGASFDNSRDSTMSGIGVGDKKEAYIGKGSKIVGNLQFSGPTELDGQVEGEVIALDRLVVGEAAVINARLSGTEIVVKGVINGDIIASKRIVLKKPARVMGSLVSPLLSIEEGVVFEGKISMIAAEKKATETGSGENKAVVAPGSSLSKQPITKLDSSKPGFTAVS